jgi:uncharacterized protein (DUF433 family)
VTLVIFTVRDDSIKSIAEKILAIPERDYPISVVFDGGEKVVLSDLPAVQVFVLGLTSGYDAVMSVVSLKKRIYEDSSGTMRLMGSGVSIDELKLAWKEKKTDAQLIKKYPKLTQRDLDVAWIYLRGY